MASRKKSSKKKSKASGRSLGDTLVEKAKKEAKDIAEGDPLADLKVSAARLLKVAKLEPHPGLRRKKSLVVAYQAAVASLRVLADADGHLARDLVKKRGMSPNQLIGANVFGE